VSCAPGAADLLLPGLLLLVLLRARRGRGAVASASGPSDNAL